MGWGGLKDHAVSHATRGIAPGRVTQAGQVEGYELNENIPDLTEPHFRK
jgi:hypothetical protein